MTLRLKQLTLTSLFILGISTGYAQNWFSNEIGVIVGPIAFQSDFGERSDFETNSGNTGFGIGFIHYMNFDYRPGGSVGYSFFNDHFMVRSELSFNRTKLKHFGKWVDSNKTGINADKLRAHSGAANNIDMGMQLEFYPISIKEFSYAINTFSPYVSLGVHYTLFSPQVFTTYGDGDINNLDNFYSGWYLNSDDSIRDTEFITSTAGTTFSIVGSFGTRYKLSRLSDVVLDLRWQYYFSDKVDGLNHKLPSNKSKDYLVWLNVGYIFYLQ